MGCVLALHVQYQQDEGLGNLPNCSCPFYSHLKGVDANNSTYPAGLLRRLNEILW